MAYPPLIDHPDQASYERHFETTYCRAPVATFDGIQVRFQKRRFWHAFFESTQRNIVKNRFSFERARRIDWIRATLQDPCAELHVGWDKSRKKHDSRRRVALVQRDYVVIIALTGPGRADFITAFIVTDTQTIVRIRNSPRWTKENR